MFLFQPSNANKLGDIHAAKLNMALNTFGFISMGSIPLHCNAAVATHTHTRTRDCTNGLKNLRVFVNTVFFFLSFAYLLNRTALDFCLICFFCFCFYDFV